MQIPVELIQKLLGVISGSVSGGYKNLELFAQALERIAADARKLDKE